MATVYIYRDAEFNNYHSGGGAVVVANGADDYDRLVAEAKQGEYGQLVDLGPLTHSYTLPVDVVSPDIFLFPNAGCC